MSLIHAVVAHGATILAEASNGDHNFSQAVHRILSKIPPNNSKLTYVWEQYLFHYVSENGIIYLVMAEDSLGRRVPFTFLLTLQRQFTASHPSPPTSDHALQQSFGPVLSKLMSDFNAHQTPGAPSSSSALASGANADAIQQAQNELTQVKDIMVHNVEQILSRGERIELLVDKTDTMAGQSLAFRRGAKAARRKMFWKNQKIVALSVAVGLIFVYLITAQFCGAGLNHC